MAVTGRVARPLAPQGDSDSVAPPPVAMPLRAPEEHPTAATRILPPRDRALWDRVVRLCTDLDRVYFDGRHAALAADELSLVAGVVRGLEERLAGLHRLIVRTRTLSTDREDLLAGDAERLEAHLAQTEGYRRENLTLSTACRRLHEEKCSLERQLREATKRVARQSAGRMEAAHLVERIRELERELAATRRRLARAEQRVATTSTEELPVVDESLVLRRRLESAERQLAELEQDNDRLIRERDELHADLATARTEMIARDRRAG